MSEPESNTPHEKTPAAPQRVIHLPLGERSYDIVIRNQLINEAGGDIALKIKGRRCLVVTDRNVGPKHGYRLFRVAAEIAVRRHHH